MSEMSAAKKYDQDMRRLAQEEFKDHVISKQSEGRWLLQKPYKDGSGWEWNMAAEVISLAGGELYVGGDIDFVIFSYFSVSRDLAIEKSHEYKVRWMGEHSDIRYYVAQKATIGTGHQLTNSYNEDVAVEEVQDWFDEYLKDLDKDEVENNTTLQSLKNILDNISFYNAQELREALYEEGLDSERIGGIGEVVAPRVYFAHAALRRLCQLLDEARAASLEKVQDVPASL